MNKTLLIHNEEKSERMVMSVGYCFFDEDGSTEYTSRATRDYRLIYVQRGTLRFVKNGKNVASFAAGRLILLTPGSRDLSICTSDCRDFWVSFTGFSDVMSRLSIQTNGICSHKCEKDDKIVQAYIEDIITELQLKERGYSIAAEARLLRLLLYFCRENPRGNLSRNSEIKKLSPALLLMNNEFSKTYPMEFYAQRCNMSKSSFLHNFSKTMHTTPVKYINDIKIKNAYSLLTETDMPIGEIASALGFSSSQYFSKTFFAYSKTTPRDYRNAHGIQKTKNTS